MTERVGRLTHDLRPFFAHAHMYEQAPPFHSSRVTIVKEVKHYTNPDRKSENEWPHPANRWWYVWVVCALALCKKTNWSVCSCSVDDLVVRIRWRHRLYVCECFTCVFTCVFARVYLQGGSWRWTKTWRRTYSRPLSAPKMRGKWVLSCAKIAFNEEGQRENEGLNQCTVLYRAIMTIQGRNRTGSGEMGGRHTLWHRVWGISQPCDILRTWKNIQCGRCCTSPLVRCRVCFMER